MTHSVPKTAKLFKPKFLIYTFNSFKKMSTRVRAAIKLGSLTPEGKVTKTQGILDAMQASGNFPLSDMPITYSTLQTLVDNLHNAIIATNSGSPSATSNMHEQERVLVNAFNFIKSHVEYVANNTLDPATMIVSAGMQVATQGGANGVTELTLEALGNGKLQVRIPRGTDEKAFVYEISADGATFNKATSSSLTKITISNLQPASTIYIRYYAIGKNGEGAISQVKNVIVV